MHLVPLLGPTPLDAITNERVQWLKGQLAARAPKTMNNVLTVLNSLLKRAVEWGDIERMPCAIRLLPVPKPSARFHDLDDYERLVEAAQSDDGARVGRRERGDPPTLHPAVDVEVNRTGIVGGTIR